jgi:tetratricopeptide (TPR) repeat protein
MLTGKLRWLFLAVCLLSATAYAQEAQQLEPGKAVERQIAGGQSHTYQISLAAGQFARFRLEQRAIDAALTLTAPDGKQLVEMSLTRAGDEESLSLEATVEGNYRLTVQVVGLATLSGTYRIEAMVQAAATMQDKQRIVAESLMIESEKLVPQGGKAAPKIIENLQQALRIWRQQNEQSWEAWSLLRIGYAYSDLSQQEKAIEYLGQGLSLYHAAKYRCGEGEMLFRLGTAHMRLRQYE